LLGADGFESEGEGAGSEEGSFGRVGFAAGEDEVFDAVDEAVEVGERAGDRGRAEEGGLDAGGGLEGDGAVVAGGGEHEGDGLEAVAIAEVEEDGLLGGLFDGPLLCGGVEGPGGVEERAGPGVLGEPGPDGFVCDRLDVGDAGFATFTAFDEALEGFEEMEAVGVEGAVADGGGVGDGRFELGLEGGGAGGDGEGGAGEEGDFQLPSAAEHGLGFGPIVGEVLIEEGGDDAAGLLVDVEDFVEEFEAGVEMLAEVVEGVVAVFADEDDAVDGELGGAEGEGFADGGVDLEAVAGGEVAGHVVGGDLGGVERYEVCARRGPEVVGGVAAEEPAADDVGVGVPAILGDDGGDALAGGGGEAGEELAAKHAVFYYAFLFLH